MAENVRAINSVKGSVFDYQHALLLPDDDCKVLVVSTRTLYFIQAFSRGEIGYLARYAREFLEGDQYVVADSPGEVDNISDIMNRYRLEVVDVTCDLVAAIEALTISINVNACGCPVGEGVDTDDGERGGDVPPPVGSIVYQEPSVIEDRDCKAANLVHETLLNVFTELNNYNVDDMAIYGLQFTIGVVGAAIAVAVAAPMVALCVAVAGLLAIFGARLLTDVIDLQNLVDAMTARQEELVCILYDSTVASDARAAYLVELEDWGITAIESALLELFMTNALMDTLYFDTSDLAAFWPTYSGPVDCDLCGEGAPTDWMIIPNCGWPFGSTTPSGYFGIGTVEQGPGVPFVITGDSRDDAPGQYVIALVVKGFWDELATPCNPAAGDVTALAGLGLGCTGYTGTAPFTSLGMYATVCGGTLWVVPPGTTIPNNYPNYLIMAFFANGPFTMTFEVNATPTICP